MIAKVVFVCALAVSVSVGAAQQLFFDGRDYRLDRVEVKANEIVNHYTPMLQGAEQITSHLSVHKFTGKSSTDEVVNFTLEGLQRALIDAPLIRRDAEDVIAIMFCRTPETNRVEYVLQRFTHLNDAVVSYRFSQIVPAESDVTPMLARQPQRIDQIFTMRAPVRDAL